jgi:hypothetical protein
VICDLRSDLPDLGDSSYKAQSTKNTINRELQREATTLQSMHLIPTPTAGVFEAETTPVGDQRGQLTRLFCRSELQAAHGHRPIVQINHTLTRPRTTTEHPMFGRRP